MSVVKRVSAVGAAAALAVALLGASPAAGEPDFGTQSQGQRTYNFCTFNWFSWPDSVSASANLNPSCVDARVQVRAAYSDGGRGITRLSTWGVSREITFPLSADILYQEYRVDNNGSGPTSPWYDVTFD